MLGPTVMRKRKMEMKTEDGNNIKRKLDEATNCGSKTLLEKPAKRFFPLTRPTKIQTMPFILNEHRHRLCNLLRKLLGDHNFKEASGVLSTFLKGTSMKICPIENRRKYWAAMEILSRNGRTSINTLKIKRIYEIWISKQGWKMSSTMEKKYLIQLEFSLFLLTQGNIEEAYNSIKFLAQDSSSASDPIVNMMTGLILYQLWYLGIPKEMQLGIHSKHMPSEGYRMEHGDVHHVKPDPDLEQGDIFQVKLEPRMGHSDTFQVKSAAVEYSEENSAFNVRDQKSFAHCSSDRSVGNVKQEISIKLGGAPENVFYMKESAKLSEKTPTSVNCDDTLIDASISFPYGLDRSLLPLQLEKSTVYGKYPIDLQGEVIKEHYINAVEHLRLALHSFPLFLAALLPLIQLLLLGDQVEEAVEELKKFCHKSSAVLPFRLRANLLECFSRKQPTVVTACYEDVMKKDPTCTYSLAVLIRMYKDGNYTIESLLEMIALHLDATYAAADVWKELASCFLKLKDLMKYQYDEDQMSVAQHMNDSGAMQAHFTSTSTIPGVFTKEEARKSWKLRCRWWSTRHFGKNACASEIKSGDLELLTFKASCASHMYGPDSDYARSVYGTLKNNQNEERLLILQRHFRDCLNLMGNLNRTAK